jgi:hypothetical protein
MTTTVYAFSNDQITKSSLDPDRHHPFPLQTGRRTDTYRDTDKQQEHKETDSKKEESIASAKISKATYKSQCAWVDCRLAIDSWCFAVTHLLYYPVWWQGSSICTSACDRPVCLLRLVNIRLLSIRSVCINDRMNIFWIEISEMWSFFIYTIIK